MNQDLIPVSLTPAEYRLLMGLRDVPESSLKNRVKALIEALLSMAREPRCPEQQSDGVPCASVHANCVIEGGELTTELLAEWNGSTELTIREN